MSLGCQHYCASPLQAVINHNNNHNEDDLGLSLVGPSPWEWDPGVPAGPGSWPPLPGMCPHSPQAHACQMATAPRPDPTLQFQTSTDPAHQEEAATDQISSDLCSTDEKTEPQNA